jgi:fructokinase
VITVVGEALLDLVAGAEGRSFAAHPGGSPANVAVGLARLGTSVTLATQLGEDLPGRLVREHLRESGVQVELLPARSSFTSLALAAVDERGVASYDFRLAWDVTRGPTLASDCVCLHTGSLATAFAPGAEVLENLIAREHRRGEIVVSLDPNIRPSLVGSRDEERSRVERQVSQADIVKVSADDLHWLYPDVDPQKVAARWLACGPALVVVTLGAEGAYALTHAAEVTRPPMAVQVVDTVGAGDAFTSGLLDALHRAGSLGGAQRVRLAHMDAASLADVIDFATRVAAVTCSRPGADPPTRADLNLLLRAHGKDDESDGRSQ